MKPNVFFYPFPMRYCQLQETKTMKSIVAKYLSHHIRSPLNTVSLGLTCAMSNLERLESVDTETTDMVRDALSSCVVISGVLDNIVTYEALTTKTLKLFPKNYRVHDIVSRAVEAHILAVSIR